jgi:hypothetical protein
MAWQTEMVEILRVMINDMDSPYKFSDNRLEKVIVAASSLVLNDTPGKFSYISDITEISITPDPTDRTNNTRNDDFVTLTLLKSACFIDNCNVRDAARKGGISIREWNTSIDTRGIFASALSLLESDKGWCQQYEDALFQFLAGNASVGVGVFGPFRLIYNAYNSSPGYHYSNNELFGNRR